jgi:hypothetical protein
MVILVVVTMLLLLITKGLDLFSTLMIIRHPCQETNPIAGRLMQKFGIGRAIWGIAAIALVIILATACWAINTELHYQIGYVAVGLFVSFIQYQVARCNLTGRDTPVTLLVRRLHSVVKR